MKHLIPIPFFVLLLAILSCNAPSERRDSPHKRYEMSLVESGLDKTSMGRRWLIAANECLTNPQQVTIPYSETGYFEIDTPSAIGFRFNCKRGQKLTVEINVKPARTFHLFADLFKSSSNEPAKWIASADSIKTNIEYNIETAGDYLLRLQPELLTSGNYTLTISYGPSLAFPVRKGKIESVWGDARDGGARKHEGVDIFAQKYSPVLACADGEISRVNENNLGGNVVWQAVNGRKYQLYYAHLDKQLVREGQDVKIGDTIGLVGNTGNARTTPAHLHFGVYTFGGAVDPLPFLEPNPPQPQRITAAPELIGLSCRTIEPARLYTAPNIHGSSTQIDKSAFLKVEAATAEWYRVITFAGNVGYISSLSVTLASKPLQQVVLNSTQPVFDMSDSAAATKEILAKGERVDVLSHSDHFYFIRYNGKEYGWMHQQ